MTEPSERTFDLLDRARSGDPRALDQLFARYLPRLNRWARGRLPAWARGVCDTNDLVQEVLLQTFTRIDAFEPRREGALQAYVRQAVRNRVVDELRRVQCRPQAVEPGREVREQVDEAASPLEAAIGSQAAERYERALTALRPEDREAIVGRVELGLSYEELATTLEKPSADAARKAAQRALLKLAEEMARQQ